MRISAAMCLLVSFAAHAESPPMAGLPEVIETKAKAGVLPPTVRTVLGFQIGKHGLRDVHKRLGAPIIRLSQSDGASKGICVESSNARDQTRVVFEAGPLGGFETLTAVTVGPRDAFPATSMQCSQSAVVSKVSAAAGTVGIGMALEQTARTLKADISTTKSGLSEINFERVQRSRDPKGKLAETEISSGIVAHLIDHRIHWFSIYYVEGS